MPLITGPEGITTHNDIRYLISVLGTDDEYDWAIEGLSVDYDGCDGLCTYGCGADPWTVIQSGSDENYNAAMWAAEDALAQITRGH